jgi:hypothetical protein
MILENMWQTQFFLIQNYTRVCCKYTEKLLSEAVLVA